MTPKAIFLIFDPPPSVRHLFSNVKNHFVLTLGNGQIQAIYTHKANFEIIKSILGIQIIRVDPHHMLDVTGTNDQDPTK